MPGTRVSRPRESPSKAVRRGGDSATDQREVINREVLAKQPYANTIFNLKGEKRDAPLRK